MGATFVSYRVHGYSASEAFDELRKNLREEYGCRSYSGTANNAQLGYMTKRYSGLITDANIKEATSIVNKSSDDEDFEKDVLLGIDLGIECYEIISTKKVIKKVTSKWETYYVVRSGDFDDDKILFKDKNKKIAEDKMLELGITYPDCYTSKEPVLVSGNAISSTINRSVKKAKKFPTKTKKNEIVKELHQYYFYGYVSE